MEKLKRPLQLKNDRIRKKRASHKKYKKVIANAKEKLKRQRNRLVTPFGIFENFKLFFRLKLKQDDWKLKLRKKKQMILKLRAKHGQY